MVVPMQRQTSVMVEVSGRSESQTSPMLTEMAQKQQN